MPYQATGERVRFHRDDAIDGVEVRFFSDSALAWSFYSANFEFLPPGKNQLARTRRCAVRAAR
jgi:hypothetical protein